MSRSFRWLAGFGTVTAALAALLVPVTAQAVTEDYGSIAYSPSTGVMVAGRGFTQNGAKMAALYECVAQGGGSDCWALDWYHDAIGSFAASPNGDYGTGQGWADGMSQATSTADYYAKQTCQKYGGTGCQVVFRGYTAYVSSSGTGGGYPQPTIPGMVIPVNAGTKLPPGTYWAAGGPSFGQATCLGGLVALGVATVYSDGTVEIAVPGLEEVSKELVEDCGEFVLSSVTDE
jgi:Domain of unknown function (DUF4189)